MAAMKEVEDICRRTMPMTEFEVRNWLNMRSSNYEEEEQPIT